MKRALAGFSLIEVTLALGVAGFCLVAIFGLLPVGLNSNQTAIQQTAATSILTSIAADLRGTARQENSTAQYGITMGKPKTLFFTQEGKLVSNASAGRYRATVSFITSAAAPAPTATMALVKITWPAPVDPASANARPAGSAESFIALDRI